MADSSGRRCLAKQAYQGAYEKVYGVHPSVREFSGECSDAGLLAKALQAFLGDTEYRPHEGDAIELVYDRDALELLHLQCGGVVSEAPTVAAVFRRGFFGSVVEDDGEESYIIDPNAPIEKVVTPDNDLLSFVAGRLLERHGGDALRAEHLWSTEYDSLVATPCWLCTGEGCPEREPLPSAVPVRTSDTLPSPLRVV